jgi:hypothetical protein
MSDTTLDFDFDMQDIDRQQLLSETRRTVSALQKELGPEAGAEPGATDDLFDHLNNGVAKFSAFPDVVELAKDHFTSQGLKVPPLYEQRVRDHRYIWLRFPVTLFPPEDIPFYKLECAVEFNRGEAQGYLRPRAQLILPDKKFKKYFEADTGLEVRIGENFEFEASIPKIGGEAGGAKVKLGGDVDAKAAAKLGFVAGPFHYSMKKAILDHSGIGTEKVIWRLSGAEFFQEEEPTLIAVLEVPRTTELVNVTAVLQAYHKPNFLIATLGNLFKFLSKRPAEFLGKGAPLVDQQKWDITPRLAKN